MNEQKRIIFSWKEFKEGYLESNLYSIQEVDKETKERVHNVLKWIWDEMLIIDSDTSKTLNRLLSEGKETLNEYFGEDYRKHLWSEFADTLGQLDPVEGADYE